MQVAPTLSEKVVVACPLLMAATVQAPRVYPTTKEERLVGLVVAGAVAAIALKMT